MNNRQKRVQNAILKSEKQIIKELKETYQKALNDINQVIADLLARNDIDNLQSIIYQVNYQKSLKKQLEGFLEVLQSNNYDKISAYLESCYKENWVGTLYDLQGQGVPLFMPINQEQIIKAITTNSKLSLPLYKKLGLNIEELRLNIQAELSRGISQAMSYQQIAKNLKNVAQLDYNRSLRIAKTEGHRVSQESAFNCQTKAIKNGAKIKKVWDSTLDSRTRPTHQTLDGQTVDVNKPFTSESGYTAMYPGGFGVASEDCNCRCCVLQKASWDTDSMSKFVRYNDKESEIRDFGSVEDYEKFKSEFWRWNK